MFCNKNMTTSVWNCTPSAKMPHGNLEWQLREHKSAKMVRPRVDTSAPALSNWVRRPCRS